MPRSHDSFGWRPCPFDVGKEYRVRKDFKSLRDSFLQDEVLTFMRDAYSRYDGYTGFFFVDRSGRAKAWDVDDEANLDVHIELFEEA